MQSIDDEATYLLSGSGVVMALVTQHIFSGIRLQSPCRGRQGLTEGLGGSDDKEDEGEEVKVMGGGAPGRGDSGGGVSQLICDTGEPLFMYGVASRMYLTEGRKKRDIGQDSMRFMH